RARSHHRRKPRVVWWGTRCLGAQEDLRHLLQNFLGLGPPDFLGWGPPDFLKLDPPDFLGLGPPPREPSAMTVWPCTVVGFARGGRGRNGAEEVHGGSICRDQAAAVGGSRLARDCASVEMLATHGSRSARWHACLARPT